MCAHLLALLAQLELLLVLQVAPRLSIPAADRVGLLELVLKDLALDLGKGKGKGRGGGGAGGGGWGKGEGAGEGQGKK